MESIQDKLRSLGVDIGSRGVEKTAFKRNAYPVEEVIRGYLYPTIFGNSFISNNYYPQNYEHGLICLEEMTNLELISQWAKAPKLSDDNFRNILFLDTETSGLSGGTGTLVFMVGLGYFDEDGFNVSQLFLRNPGDESAFLTALDELVAPFEVLITYNGKSFDLPTVKSRYVMNGLLSPFDQYNHIDLLHLARRLWRKRIPSRTLGNIEKEIIGFSRTEKDVPGWMIPEIYFNYLRDGDARPMKSVFYHNAMDVVTCLALFVHITRLLSNPLQQDHINNIDLTEIARLYEELGHIDIAALLYEQCINEDLPMSFYKETLHRYATLHRRRGEWTQAEGLWVKAAERNDYCACIELAKYYEHRTKEYEKAALWVMRGLEYLDEISMKKYEKKVIINSIQHRLQRLERKSKG